MTDENRDSLRAINIALRDAVRAFPAACRRVPEPRPRDARAVHDQLSERREDQARPCRGSDRSYADDRDLAACSTASRISRPRRSSRRSPHRPTTKQSTFPTLWTCRASMARFNKLIEKGPPLARVRSKVIQRAARRRSGRHPQRLRLHVVCRLIEGGFTDGEIVSDHNEPRLQGVASMCSNRSNAARRSGKPSRSCATRRSAVPSMISPEDDFGADPLDPLTPEEEQSKRNSATETPALSRSELWQRKQV